MKVICYVYPKYRLGTHVPLMETVLQSVQQSLQKGMTCMQLFLGSPQSVNSRQLSDDDVRETRHLLDRFRMACFVHAPYILNLAKDSDKRAFQLRCVESLLSKTAQFGGSGVVLHPGSNPDQAQGITCLAKGLSEMKIEENQYLLIENMAGQGNVLGGTLEDLAAIWSNISSQSVQEQVFFCIDTAHLWGRGEYRIDTVEGVRAFWTKADHMKMSSRIRLVHLNDSAVPFGSRVDRHALLGEGQIWQSDESKVALKSWMDECSKRAIPMVMETDPSDIEKFYMV